MGAVSRVIICFCFAAIIGLICNTLGHSAIEALAKFTSASIFETIGTIFAINVGFIPFFYHELTKLEKELELPNCLQEPKKEIKQNIAVMTIIVIVSAVLCTSINLVSEYPILSCVLSSLVLFLFFLTVIMLHDSVSGILEIDIFYKNEQTQNNP
jgi:hypothetical protein